MNRRDFFIKTVGAAATAAVAPIMAANVPASTAGISLRFIKSWDIARDQDRTVMLMFHREAFAMVMRELP